MKVADFRTQTTIVSTPSTGVVAVYANTSGILIAVNENGVLFQVGTQVTGNISMANQTVSTGFGLFKQGGGTVQTGLFYGSTGTYSVPTLLGAPVGFLPFTGPSGELIGIPYYTRS